MPKISFGDDAIMTSHRTILDRTQFYASGVQFSRDESVEIHMVPRDLWEEMGSPNEITVTVEPGDKLNESEEDR